MGLTRWFQRLPACDSVTDALDHCEDRGYQEPRLHECHSAVVVGLVEVEEPQS